MKITEKDIAPGKVFYNVFFLPGRSAAKLESKVIVTAFVIFVVLSAVFGGGKGKKGKRKSRAGSGQNGYVYSHKNR